MKRITVNAYEVALILKRGKLVNVLTEGKHWVGFGKNIRMYNTTLPFAICTTEMILMAESDLLKNHLTVVNIEDNMLGIETKDGKYTRVLKTGKIGYWKSPIQYTVEKLELITQEVPASIPKYILMKPEILQYLRVFPIESYQKGLLHIDGKFVKIMEPGVYYYWKTEEIATVKSIDMRLQNLELSGQELLTKDKAGIRVNFSAQYQVSDLQKAMVDTKDFEKQFYTILQLTLRAYVGTLTLDQLIASKDAIGPYIMKEAQEAAAEIGVEIGAGGIKDIILPGDVKEIMNQVLIAQKKAQANTIMRQEETASTRSLLNTAKLMEQNTMLMKLKEMEYMEKISEKIGEITVNGGSAVIDQLKQMVVAK